LTNAIIDGLTARLAAKFPDAEIYAGEDVLQALRPPCFFVLSLGGSRENFQSFPSGGSLGLWLRPFDVHYWPESEGSYAEIQGVADTLYSELDTLELLDGDFVRGTQMRHEVVDGVLHFFINFNARARVVAEPTPQMEDLTIFENVEV
jgi:hypothetical protein